MTDLLFKDTVVPLLLRLGLAVIFLYQGAVKVATPGNEAGATWATKAWAKNPELRPAALESALAQFAVAWGELLGGAAMLLGLLTRVAAVGLVAIMAGAVWTVTGMQGFSPPGGGGWQQNFAIVVLCAAVFLLGAGTLSVDRFVRWRRRRKKKAALAAAR